MDFSIGELITTSIRPTVFYGEEDPYLFPTMAKMTKKTGGIIPKLLGAGGKHQMTYVGTSVLNIVYFYIAISKLTQTPKPNNKMILFSQEMLHGPIFVRKKP